MRGRALQLRLGILWSVATLVAQANGAAYCLDGNGGSQYIRYDGTISAKRWDSQLCCENLDPHLVSMSANCNGTGAHNGPSVNTQLYIGVNPPWDSNPFFFELWHLESETSYVLFSEDDILNLDFGSAAWACGISCGTFEGVSNFSGEQKLDLKNAKIQRDGGFYTVSGDSKTWVGKDNAEFIPGVTIARSSCDYLDQNHHLVTTVSWVDFQW
jgi:hypothetical protein